MILLNLRRDVRFIRRGKSYSLNKGDSLKMHWLRLLPILMLRLTAAIPAFGAGTGQPGWVEELDRTMVECGQKIDRAYPPLHIAKSSLDLQSISLSSGQDVFVVIQLTEPQEGVKEIFWMAKDLKSAQAFIQVLKKGAFERLLIRRSTQIAHRALVHHKVLLFLGLSLGKRDPQYEDTLEKIEGFLDDLKHCPTPSLIRVFNPCIRCPIEKIERSIF